MLPWHNLWLYFSNNFFMRWESWEESNWAFLSKQCFLALKNIAAMFFTKDFHKVCYPSASSFVDCDCTQVRPQHRTNIWNYVEHKCIISVNKEKLTKAKCCVLVELLHNTKYNIIKAISNSSMSFYSIQSFTKTLWHLL